MSIIDKRRSIAPSRTAWVACTVLSFGLVASNVAAQSHRHNSAATEPPSRFETPLFVKTTVTALTTTASPHGNGEGGIAGVCPPVVTQRCDPAVFSGGSFLFQAGFVESEIAAVTFVAPPEAFPVTIRTMEMIFGAMPHTVTETTEYSVLIWEGTPNSGMLVDTFSSDGTILPHIVLPPSSSPQGINVQITVDPGDPDQVIVQNNGSNSFTIGYRIDSHNSPPLTSCPCPGCSFCGTLPAICCPPAQNLNTFPTTDTNGHAGTAQFNWLFARPCPGATGICAAAPGWYNFTQAGMPSGDWVIRATYEPFDCLLPTGACCLPSGNCANGLTQNECSAAAGTFQGDGTNCTANPCPQPVGACCVNGACSQQTLADCNAQGGTFLGLGVECGANTCRGACCVPATGNCVFTTEPNCDAASGIFQGIGVTCGTIVCFPTGACCLPNGQCANGPMSPEDCEALGGIFQGNASTCGTVSCPEPIGACCLGTVCLGDETQANCENGFGGEWAGPDSACGQFTCPYCPADVQPSGVVNIDDLLIVIGAWGACSNCPADIHPVPFGNNQVNIDDLLLVISSWGACQ